MAVLNTLGLQQSIRNGWPRAYLAYIDHPDGEVWVWSGIGDLVFDGQTYGGVGQFGRISGVGGSKELGVRQVIFDLAGVPDEAAKQLNKDVRNRVARAWVAGLDRDGMKVNGAPWQIVDGLADYQDLPAADDGTVVVRLVINEPVFSIERAQDLAWTPEWLEQTHGGGITGLDRVAGLANAAENWTRT